ncbi:MAG TPA: hypothetical protein VEL28_17455, partial [Candidatus Binatia bacterium]|nr:hypothetical protein [Candidatus Binatia bacterium]
PIRKVLTEAELRAGVEEYREPQTPAAEPLVPIIGADGQPVLVPRSQAINQRPASAREQGRPVTSGDAGRIADLDTSLNDLQTLRGEITTQGGVGTASRIGAALPNVISETFGWGESAKQRQAVIDRVKQVIGKALEGGVLRKEDEYKYAKILPTIGDTPAVAKSKLDGLETALIQRRQTTLNALEDAGYDTGQFRARETTTSPKPTHRFNPATGKVEPIK